MQVASNNCKWLETVKGNINQLQVARLYFSGRPSVNRFAEKFLRVLGFDWLLLFLQHQVVVRHLGRLLLSVSDLLARFREGVTTASANGWTRSKDVLLVIRPTT